MPRSEEPQDTAAVTTHIQKLDPAIIPAVEALRQLILAVDGAIGERIKWNNPSFFYMGEMPPFDPKEYKRDMVVMNLHKNRLMLVLPSGAKIDDTTGLLEGNYADGRRLVVFKDLDNINARRKQLQEVLRQWIAMANS